MGRSNVRKCWLVFQTYNDSCSPKIAWESDTMPLVAGRARYQGKRLLNADRHPQLANTITYTADLELSMPYLSSIILAMCRQNGWKYSQPIPLNHLKGFSAPRKLCWAYQDLQTWRSRITDTCGSNHFNLSSCFLQLHCSCIQCSSPRNVVTVAHFFRRHMHKQDPASSSSTLASMSFTLIWR